MSRALNDGGGGGGVCACVRVCMCAWQACSTFHLAEVGGGRRASLLPSAQWEVSMQALGPASTDGSPG